MALPLAEQLHHAALPEIDGGWKTILADPPWRFANRTGKVAPEHRRLDRYSTMDLEAILDLPVTPVAARNAHLYLWVPNALLPEGMAFMKAWGFRYVSNVVWAKRRKDGGPDGRGVGFYFRNVTELILFGVRGSMRTLSAARSQVNMIETRKREHSRKPDEQYGFIERCSPGPYLEMFARYPQPKWVCWGAEAARDVQPRGRQHKGYRGGPMAIPDLPAHARLTGEEAEQLGEQLKLRYEAGSSIRAYATCLRKRSTRLRASDAFSPEPILTFGRVAGRAEKAKGGLVHPRAGVHPAAPITARVSARMAGEGRIRICPSIPGSRLTLDAPKSETRRTAGFA